MQKNPRLYDKVATRKQIKKYFIMLVCLIPILVVLNLTILKDMESIWRIVIDVLVALAIIFLIDSIMKNREEKKKINKGDKK